MQPARTQALDPVTDRSTGCFLLGCPPRTVRRFSRTFPNLPPQVRAMPTPLLAGRSLNMRANNIFGPQFTTSTDSDVPTRVTGERDSAQLREHYGAGQGFEGRHWEDRDSIVGENARNMHYALLLLSSFFLNSKWCQLATQAMLWFLSSVLRSLLLQCLRFEAGFLRISFFLSMKLLKDPAASGNYEQQRDPCSVCVNNSRSMNLAEEAEE